MNGIDPQPPCPLRWRGEPTGHGRMFIVGGAPQRHEDLRSLCPDALCPEAEYLKDGAQLCRIADGFKAVILDPVEEPVGFAVVDPHPLKRLPCQCRVLNVDLHCPAWIVESIDRDSVLVLPIAVALARVPLLEPFEEGVALASCRHASRRVRIRLPNASTLATRLGKTTVVEPNSSTMAGPSMVSPAPR